MARAKRQADAGKRVDATEQPHVTDLLRGTYDKLCLWRTCTKKACRRRRGCGGDVDQCGPRSFPNDWTWVEHVLQAIRDGQPPSAAVRAADRQVRQATKRVIIHFGFGEPAEFVVNDDGTWTNIDSPRAKVKLGAQFRKLTGAAWLRAGRVAK